MATVACFTVFGVGGGGGNAVQHMVHFDPDIRGVKNSFIANTDKQANLTVWNALQNSVR